MAEFLINDYYFVGRVDFIFQASSKIKQQKKKFEWNRRKCESISADELPYLFFILTPAEVFSLNTRKH